MIPFPGSYIEVPRNSDWIMGKKQPSRSAHAHLDPQTHKRASKAASMQQPASLQRQQQGLARIRVHTSEFENSVRSSDPSCIPESQTSFKGRGTLTLRLRI